MVDNSDIGNEVRQWWRSVDEWEKIRLTEKYLTNRRVKSLTNWEVEVIHTKYKLYETEKERIET